MKIELTIKPDPGDSLTDVIDRAESFMIQDEDIEKAQFKFNGVPLYFKRGGDPAKVEKYYLKKLPDIARAIRNDVNDIEYLQKAIKFLDAITERRVVLLEGSYTIVTENQELLPIKDPLVQCDPYKVPFNGYGFEVHIKGLSFDKY